VIEQPEQLAEAIDELARRFLGKGGIVSFVDEHIDGHAAIAAYVVGNPEEARRLLPAQFRGFEIRVREGGEIVPH